MAIQKNENKNHHTSDSNNKQCRPPTNTLCFQLAPYAFIALIRCDWVYHRPPIHSCARAFVHLPFPLPWPILRPCLPPAVATLAWTATIVPNKGSCIPGLHRRAANLVKSFTTIGTLTRTVIVHDGRHGLAPTNTTITTKIRKRTCFVKNAPCTRRCGRV